MDALTWGETHEGNAFQPSSTILSFHFHDFLAMSTLFLFFKPRMRQSSCRGSSWPLSTFASTYVSTTSECFRPAVDSVFDAMKMLVAFGRCSFLVVSIFTALSACEEDGSSLTTPSFESSPTTSLFWSSTPTSCQYSAPTNTPLGTTSRCCKYYIVQVSDTCNAVASRFGNTLSEFRALNPALNDECSNLLLDIAYICISTELSMGW